jgi:hypothetical protein
MATLAEAYFKDKNGKTRRKFDVRIFDHCDGDGPARFGILNRQNTSWRAYPYASRADAHEAMAILVDIDEEEIRKSVKSALRDELVEQLIALAEARGGDASVKVKCRKRRDGTELQILMLLETATSAK